MGWSVNMPKKAGYVDRISPKQNRLVIPAGMKLPSGVTTPPAYTPEDQAPAPVDRARPVVQAPPGLSTSRLLAIPWGRPIWNWTQRRQQAKSSVTTGAAPYHWRTLHLSKLAVLKSFPNQGVLDVLSLLDMAPCTIRRAITSSCHQR